MPGGWLSAFGALALALSLALKLALPAAPLGEDLNAATADLSAALSGQGYAVTADGSGLPVVLASRAGCNLTARVLDPHGAFRDTQLLKRPPRWTVSYVWQGTWQAEMPKLGPLAELYRARIEARFGRQASRAAVVMVTRSPGCSAPAAKELNIRVPLGPVSSPDQAFVTKP